MFQTLYSRLAAVLLGLFCLLAGLLVLIAQALAEMHQAEVIQRQNWYLAERIASEVRSGESAPLEGIALRDRLIETCRVLPGVDVYVLDGEGNVLSSTAVPESVAQRKVDLRPIRRFLEGNPPLPLRGDNPLDPAQRKIFSVARVDAGPSASYLYAIIQQMPPEDGAPPPMEAGYSLSLGLWTFGASLLFAAVAGLILFATLTRRLRRLTTAIQAFQQGDFTTRVELDSRSPGDEIDQVCGAFNAMAERLTRQMKEIAATDALRRELVANVSHDLRTPLTSLQGYLETLLLKEGPLSEAESHHYLEVSLRHTERLAKLVSSLFDLAKLDSGERSLEREAFPLTELVQDIVQKFRLPAETKGVSLEASAAAELPWVWADIALVERVFENLIENALRHTSAGGRVRIDLRVEKDGLGASVSDTGEGIPPEKVPFIFDRFYQVERSHRNGTRGTGLGLAIAKRVLALHGSDIAVESAQGQGTTFRFRLPLAAPAAASEAPARH